MIRNKFNFSLFISLFAILLFSFNGSCCDPTPAITVGAPSDNGNGTFDISLEVCIGDGGSLNGITVDVTGAGTDIIAFSEPTLTASIGHVAVGSLSGGVLTYFDALGGVPPNLFVDEYTRPCFNFVITVASDPVGESIDFTGVNSQHSGSCAFTGGDNQNVSIPPAPTNPSCNDVVYDSGGAGANYSNGELITTVLCPEIPGEMVSINFTAFNIENGYDFLRIYNGTDDSSPLISSHSGTNNPGIVTSTAVSGCLTVVFESDGSVTNAGFAFSVDCPSILPIDITSFIVNCGTNGKAINWTTGSEKDNGYFIVEKTYDGQNWLELKYIAVTGSVLGASYTYETDGNDILNEYYRLRQVDENGVETFSKIISSSPCEFSNNQVELFPNPNNGIFTVNSSEPFISYSIFKSDGTHLKSVHCTEERKSISIDENLQVGIYFLSTNSSSFEKVIKFVVR